MVSRRRDGKAMGLIDTPPYIQAEVSRMNIWLGSGGGTKAVGWKAGPDQPLGPERQVLGDDPADQVGDQLGRVQGVEPGQLGGQPGPEGVDGDHPVQQLLAPALVGQGGGQQVGQQHTRPRGRQHLGEGLVLEPGPLGPHDLVEQHVGDVGRGEAGQLQVGAVQQHLAELADLGVDPEAGHGPILTPRRGAAHNQATAEREERPWPGS